MRIDDVMDGLAAQITQAPNVYAYPVKQITVPCAVVGYPTEIEFDIAFADGGDRMVFPVWFVVGQSFTKDARSAISDILSGAGSIQRSLDGVQSFGTVRATDAQIEEITVGAITYLSARFDCEVYG